MGKTRLLGDFAQSHGAPCIGARPGDERVPYALLARLLRAVLGPGADAVSALQLLPLDDQVRSELARVLPELGAAPRHDEQRARQAVMVAWESRGPAGGPDDRRRCRLAELLPLIGMSFVSLWRRSGTLVALAAWQRCGGSYYRIDAAATH
jgi:hypothetical protein